MPPYDGRTWRRAWEAVGVRGIRSILQGLQGVGSNFLPLGTPLPERLSEAHRKALQTQEISGIRKFRPLLRPEIHKFGIAISDGVSSLF
jgi:hypothetical protein